MLSFDYTIIRSKNITSRTSISLHPEKGVIVKAPFWLPQKNILDFVTKNQDWVLRNLNKIKLPTITSKKYENGEMHLYLGVEHKLNIIRVKGYKMTTLQKDSENLNVYVSEAHYGDHLTSQIKNALLNWYLEEGIRNITEKANYFSSLIGVSYSQINLKKVSSIWGSCSASNKLSFNRKLILAPQEIIDYVVIHEVCHMRERNHSSRFWGLVFTYDKKYREHRHWLKINHGLLTI